MPIELREKHTENDGAVFIIDTIYDTIYIILLGVINVQMGETFKKAFIFAKRYEV